MFNKSIGIDLGTSTVLIYVKGKGVILNEPSVIAFDKAQDKILAVGNDARKMLGRTPKQITAVHPLENGVISSYTMADAMISAFLKKTRRNLMSASKVMMCVPSGVTDVEQRAVIETAHSIGAKEIYLIEEPMAAAIGAGIDVTKPHGSMIVDIGGGTTDIAVICAGHISAGRSLKIAGDTFDDAVVRFMRRAYNLNIGKATAEYIKRVLGTADIPDKSQTMVVKGLSTVSGLPKGVLITQEELFPEFEEITHNIIERIKEVLEETSSRLQADILERGIILTGGGSLFNGLDKLIERQTGVKAIIADDAVECVAKGAGMALDYIDGTELTFGRFYKKAYIYK